METAIKAAAKASPMDTSRAISGFYFHRLLCRVFSEENPLFILKGGQGMLARTIDARSTRDIDLLSNEPEVDAALKELRRLASIDLGDFVTFEFESARPIKTEDEYRTGMNVSIVPLLGTKRMQAVSIDLVADKTPCEDAERITPSDRIDVAGVPVFDYYVYPVAYAVADKLCAIIETHNEHPSSRVKDLVDILIYATTEAIDGASFSKQVRTETAARKLSLPKSFSLPQQWRDNYHAVFAKLCKQTGLPFQFHSLDQGEGLARKLIDPMLANEVDGKIWNFNTLQWV
ncbi:MAG: nucleotidyl transferase AbiEii/AbiGii toxin family protein [Eggerthellaceae bacterium]|nr:nucleotidyl transferase AbiEii/AbiGii toxin family protein [Eggerthellaceae bacterium]